MASISSYKKRIAQLQTWRTGAKNTTYVEQCDRALALTERAAATWLHLVNAAEAEQKAYLIYSNTRVASILKRVQYIENESRALADRIKNERDDDKLARLLLDAKHIELEKTTEQIGYDAFLLEDAFRRQRVDSVEAMQKALFDSIFAPDQKEFSKAAAIKAVEFSIGVIPGVGPAYDGAKKLWELSSRDKVKGQNTDEHLTYLDDYCISAARWCAAGEALIQSLKSSEDIYGE